MDTEQLKLIKMETFREFNKIARLSRECIITEKLDGTNAQIRITETGEFLVGSRNRWITPEDDNYGFARWANENKEELLKLGVGRHFGEWWGQGIQRKYNINEKRFSLFNTSRWTVEEPPKCCHIVPVLYKGLFNTQECDKALDYLRTNGSVASPGFMKPEGIVCYHVAGNYLFKKTLEKDEVPKSKVI
jgi:hypothetical protein